MCVLVLVAIIISRTLVMCLEMSQEKNVNE